MSSYEDQVGTACHVSMSLRGLRGGMALATGLTLGFMFSAGALGTLLSGPLADVWGFPPLFQMTSGLALAAAMLVFLFLRQASLEPTYA